MTEATPSDYYAIRVQLVHVTKGVIGPHDRYLSSMAAIISETKAKDMWNRISVILSEGGVAFQK